MPNCINQSFSYTEWMQFDYNVDYHWSHLKLSMFELQFHFASCIGPVTYFLFAQKLKNEHDIKK